MPKTSTTWKPGQVTNPNGRPKKEWTMSSLIREAVEEAGATGEPKNKIVARKLADKAVEGDIVAIKELNNRIDGMPVQKNILAGDEENPVKLDVTATLNKIYGDKPKSS